MMNRERYAVIRAKRAVSRKVRQLQRHRNVKRSLQKEREKTRETGSEARIVDAFGGIDIAVGQSWFSPQGRK